MGGIPDSCAKLPETPSSVLSLQQMGAGEQRMRLPVSNYDPVSPLLTVFILFQLAGILGPFLAEFPLTRMSTPLL